MNIQGVKDFEDIWNELLDLSFTMPIIHQGLELHRHFPEDFTRETTVAAIAICLAHRLKTIENEYVRAVQMKCPDIDAHAL